MHQAPPVVVLLFVLGVSACSFGGGSGQLSLSSDDRLVAEDRTDGRIWRIYNDCPMARNTTWVSDDDGETWRSHNGPGFINCTAGSGVRITAVSRDEASASVVLSGVQLRELWRTTDGGKTWNRMATDQSG